MSKRICLIDGHPDPNPARLIHALCNTYSDGALSAGHSLSTISISQLNIDPLRSKQDFSIKPDATVVVEREKIERADHVVLVFPLWLGSMPAATRAFFEQAARDEFLLAFGDNQKWPKKMMKGKSARVIVTMGMPAFVYRTMMGSASLKAIERGMLGIAGIKPIKHTVIGSVENIKPEKIEEWMKKVFLLGEKGD